MGIGTKSERCRGMTKVFLDGFDIVAGPQAVDCESVPLRYNTDKPEKSRIFKGFQGFKSDF